MEVENNSIRFNSHKNIAIKEMREKKKNQIRTQNVTEFSLKCLRLWDSQPPTIEADLIDNIFFHFLVKEHRF
jgi:hypothetical protein